MVHGESRFWLQKGGGGGDDDGKYMENRCRFWLPKKNRFCANPPLSGSMFCGNHRPGSEQVRIPCPLDPSHSILRDHVDAHIKVCPFRKQMETLQMQPFYQKGVNCGSDARDKLASSDIAPSCRNISSSEKRDAIYSMDTLQFCRLIQKIRNVHASVSSKLANSFMNPDACDQLLKPHMDGNLPFEEKHVVQQASIVYNMEAFGLLGKPAHAGISTNDEHLCGEESRGDEISGPAVVEFGAGRGYLAHALVDIYGIKKVFLVERRSYKLKADRTLRQKKGMTIERLRIDIEDLNLSAIKSLMGLPYLAIGKHLCGPAIDLTLRCCFSEHANRSNVGVSSANCKLEGIALATCCHHLCQWKHYINKRFMWNLGIGEDEFHAISWFTSWALDADHGLLFSDGLTQELCLHIIEEAETPDEGVGKVEELVKKMDAVGRALLGFMCKEIIDAGRLLWISDLNSDAQLVRYVPRNVSPENHLLLVKCRNCPSPSRT